MFHSSGCERDNFLRWLHMLGIYNMRRFHFLCIDRFIVYIFISFVLMNYQWIWVLIIIAIEISCSCKHVTCYSGRWSSFSIWSCFCPFFGSLVWFSFSVYYPSTTHKFGRDNAFFFFLLRGRDNAILSNGGSFFLSLSEQTVKEWGICLIHLSFLLTP